MGEIINVDFLVSQRFVFTTSKQSYLATVGTYHTINDSLWLVLSDVRIGNLSGTSFSVEVTANEIWLSLDKVISILPASLDAE